MELVVRARKKGEIRTSDVVHVRPDNKTPKRILDMYCKNNPTMCEKVGESDYIMSGFSYDILTEGVKLYKKHEVHSRDTQREEFVRLCNAETNRELYKNKFRGNINPQ